MKVVILCGGKGTRLSEETQTRPKPLVHVGEYPMLWHIMSMYSAYGYNDFVLALGHKGEMIKEYFLNFYALNNNFSINLKNREIKYLTENHNNWNVSLIDTGENTLTGGRLLRLKEHLKNDEEFMLTYGDGVSNVNIKKLIEFHHSHKKLATVTSVRAPARFGNLILDGDKVSQFSEKTQVDNAWINGGFFVLNKMIFDYLENDETILEKKPLENLTKDQQLMSFRHDGFWQCMDTLRDKEYLTQLWQSNQRPWLTHVSK